MKAGREAIWEFKIIFLHEVRNNQGGCMAKNWKLIK